MIKAGNEIAEAAGKLMEQSIVFTREAEMTAEMLQYIRAQLQKTREALSAQHRAMVDHLNDTHHATIEDIENLQKELDARIKHLEGDELPPTPEEPVVLPLPGTLTFMEAKDADEQT